MRTFILFVALLTAGPAWATSLTWQFTGSSSWLSATYATVNGSFTYDSAASPSGYNVRGRDPNVTYALTDWTMIMTNSYSQLGVANLVDFPSTIIFSNTLANNTAEFCVGECIFSSQLFEGLVFSNGLQSLQLEFLIPSLNPFLTAPPDSLEEWGSLYGMSETTGGASWFQSYDANSHSQIVGLLTDGGITGLTVGAAAPVQAVPEVNTGLLCLIGFAIVGWFHHKWRVLR